MEPLSLGWRMRDQAAARERRSHSSRPMRPRRASPNGTSETCLAEWIVDGAPTTVDLRPFRSTRFAEGQPWIDEHAYGPVPGTISR